MSELVCVRLFADKEEADIAAGYLNAYGIKALVFTDDCGGTRPGMDAGIRLTVCIEDKEDALEPLRGIK